MDIVLKILFAIIIFTIGCYMLRELGDTNFLGSLSMDVMELANRDHHFVIFAAEGLFCSLVASVLVIGMLLQGLVGLCCLMYPVSKLFGD